MISFVCLCLMLVFETNGYDTFWPRLVRRAKSTGVLSWPVCFWITVRSHTRVVSVKFKYGISGFTKGSSRESGRSHRVSGRKSSDGGNAERRIRPSPSTCRAACVSPLPGTSDLSCAKCPVKNCWSFSATIACFLSRSWRAPGRSSSRTSAMPSGSRRRAVSKLATASSTSPRFRRALPSVWWP